jgi:hypothetical protein
VPPLSADDPPRRALDILFRASSLGVEAHGRTMLRRPPAGLTVVELPAPPTALTTFDVGRSANMIDEGYDAARAWLLI